MGWTERTELLLGRERLDALAKAKVAIIGAGGVGSFAAEMVVRAGVGHVVVVDNDEVSPTNKNRQLLALDSTIGKPKCKVLAARLLDINPELDIEVIGEYLEPEGVPELFEGRNIDFVVDAIDTLAPKLALIKYCLDNQIPIVSSMGAGAKIDATKVRIADISKSYNCPLAAVVRKRLRRMGIKRGFKVVFSEELPDMSAFVACDEKHKKSNAGTISYLPAVFGCACAQVAITALTGNAAEKR